MVGIVRPLLSICIPTYNRAQKLKRLLDSIFNQLNDSLRKEIEVCISNNDSPDDTEQVINKYMLKYPGIIKYNKNDCNYGATYNGLKVYAMASGDFLWQIGDDDLFIKNAIASLVNLIKYHNSDIDFIGVKAFQENENSVAYYDGLDEGTVYSQKEFINFILIDKLSSHCFMGANIYNRKIINEFEEYNWTAERKNSWPHVYILLHNLFSFNKVVITKPLIIQTGDGLFWYRANWLDILFQKFEVIDVAVFENRIPQTIGKNLAKRVISNSHNLLALVTAKIENPALFSRVCNKISSYAIKNQCLQQTFFLIKIALNTVNFFPRFLFEFIYLAVKILFRKKDFRVLLRQKITAHKDIIREGTSC
jgi:glycosyltransferase involved in cell wall biosynthesis